MKKKIFLILILIMITTLVSCKKETKKGCEHTFQEATCTQAKTCSKCGATKGNHQILGLRFPRLHPHCRLRPHHVARHSAQQQNHNS